jgi:hypothetical protein
VVGQKEWGGGHTGVSNDVTREEHLAWCKARALEYVERGELEHAVTSFGASLTRHPGTDFFCRPLIVIGLITVTRGPAAVREWIEGFA